MNWKENPMSTFSTFQQMKPCVAPANVSNRPKDDISSDEMSVSEPSDTDEREALAQRYCPVHGDLLAGARSPRCSEAPKGHEFLHRQGQITDAMLLAAMNAKYPDTMPAPDLSHFRTASKDSMRYSLRAALEAAEEARRG